MWQEMEQQPYGNDGSQGTGGWEYAESAAVGDDRSGDVGRYASAEVPVASPAAQASRRYADTLRGGTMMLRTALMRYDTHRREVEPRLDGLYGDLPHLAPDNLRRMRQDDLKYLGYLGLAADDGQPETVRPAASQAVSTLRRFDTRSADDHHDLAVALAAASAQRHDSRPSRKAYDQLLREPQVLRYAAGHLRRNLGLFAVGGVVSLSRSALDSYGLHADALTAYRQTLALAGLDEEKLPLLASPPVHLIQLAADVINFNPKSVIPAGPRSAWGARRQTGPLPASQAAGNVTHEVRQYVAGHYGYRRWPEGRLLGTLVECALAEAQGFARAHPAQQQRTAVRASSWFGRVGDPGQLPPSARQIVEICQDMYHGTEWSVPRAQPDAEA